VWSLGGFATRKGVPGPRVTGEQPRRASGSDPGAFTFAERERFDGLEVRRLDPSSGCRYRRFSSRRPIREPQKRPKRRSFLVPRIPSASRAFRSTQSAPGRFACPASEVLLGPQVVRNDVPTVQKVGTSKAPSLCRIWRPFGALRRRYRANNPNAALGGLTRLPE